MTNYELIQKLLRYPMDMQVYVPSRIGDDYEYGKTYSVHQVEMTIQDGDFIEVILIDES
jgi:hypothetical protein